MNQKLADQLRLELQAFTRLDTSSKLKSITEAYNRILGIVQAMMLSSDKPDIHARAWNLLNNDAYKALSDVQEGLTGNLAELKSKISQVGELLLQPKA
ncbi:hypothetical protein [Spirosoma endophyticum]|uniref:Uncharacterized protein n=1 Tax=Spirosoma endophyticum TaxID=662367 RepID=A0A1I2I5T9_9BACT|nr:hypothetical protein [Spirosoma endophyticum]SFF36256.1 hypothetical protein SAMN05216167_1553 [Spirosoma endophyticum]